jgi:hypothetical protein
VSTIVAMLGKTALVVVLVVLAVFYLRLGQFLVLVWPLGALLAVAISWRDIRASTSRVLAATLVLLAFAVMSVGLWKAGTGRKELRAFDMTWQDRGHHKPSGEAEVVLEFERFPGHNLVIYSTPLRDHLKQVVARPLRATFEVTSDFGCMRGFHAVEVGGLTAWRSSDRFGHSGATGTPAESPWARDPWWCP